MNDLIDALCILRKYLDNPNSRSPLNCGHDVLWVMDVDPSKVSAEDAAELERLGFLVHHDGEAYMSYRFGSA